MFIFIIFFLTIILIGSSYYGVQAMIQTMVEQYTVAYSQILTAACKAAIDKGYKAMAAFVIQVEGVSEVRPNIETHPEFGVALNEAKEAGVEVLNLECNVKKDELTIKASKSL